MLLWETLTQIAFHWCQTCLNSANREQCHWNMFQLFITKPHNQTATSFFSRHISNLIKQHGHSAYTILWEVFSGKVGIFFLLFNISIRRGRLVPCTCLSKQMSSACSYSCSWLCYGVCDKMITCLFLLRSVCRWGWGCRNTSPTLHCQGDEVISAQGLGLQCPRKLGIFSDEQRAEVRCEM